jgi:hypothetical protein
MGGPYAAGLVGPLGEFPTELGEAGGIRTRVTELKVP